MFDKRLKVAGPELERSFISFRNRNAHATSLVLTRCILWRPPPCLDACAHCASSTICLMFPPLLTQALYLACCVGPRPSPAPNGSLFRLLLASSAGRWSVVRCNRARLPVQPTCPLRPLTPPHAMPSYPLSYLSYSLSNPRSKHVLATLNNARTIAWTFSADSGRHRGRCNGSNADLYVDLASTNTSSQWRGEV